MLDSSHYFKGVNVKILGTNPMSAYSNVDL